MWICLFRRFTKAPQSPGSPRGSTSGVHPICRNWNHGLKVRSLCFRSHSDAFGSWICWKARAPAYNIPAVLEIEGNLDESSLEKALLYLTARHPMLRLAIPSRDGFPLPHLLAPFNPLTKSDLSESRDPQGDAAIVAAEHAARPFDLTTGPLFRLHLIRLEPRRYRLLVNMHHIVSDGWSVDLLIQELGHCYSAYRRGEEPSLPPLRIQYPDFAFWQQNLLQGPSTREQVAWWKDHLADLPERLELPTDFARGSDAAAAGGEIHFLIEREIVRDLEAIAKSADLTLFMSLLAAFSLLLYRYSGQADVCIGTPVAARNRIELEGIVGLFLNTLAIRTRIPHRATFSDVLADARALALGAYSRQEIPFEFLVEELRPQRSLGHHPLFQVMLNLVNTRNESVALEGCAS